MRKYPHSPNAQHKSDLENPSKKQTKKEQDKELDKTLKDTFPASDSTAKY